MPISITFARLAALLLFAAVGLSACSEPSQPIGLSAEGAWARALPPGKTVTAGFAVLHNHGTSRCEISALSSPQAERVELHSALMEDGMMRMRPMASPAIGAGESMTLQPGGDHLMLIGLDEHAGHGGPLSVTVVSSCGELILALPLLASAPTGDHSHH